MADVAPRDDAEQIDDPICDICGLPIDELDQQCPALDDGRCRP